MAAIALLKFTQGVRVGEDGHALIVLPGAEVEVSNGGDNADVLSWRVSLLDGPPGSSFERVPGTPLLLAEDANSSVPAASVNPGGEFPPGSYRISLSVWTGAGFTGDMDVDIRNFAVPTPNKRIILPPYQKLPDPLPLAGSGLLGEKPDELNFEGQPFGWSGANYDHPVYGQEFEQYRLINAALSASDDDQDTIFPDNPTTPTAISADVTTWGPSTTSDIYLVDFTGNFAIRSLVAPAAKPTVRWVVNIGNGTGLLTHEDGAATDVNRWLGPTGEDVPLPPGCTAIVWYTGTRWLIVSVLANGLATTAFVGVDGGGARTSMRTAVLPQSVQTITTLNNGSNRNHDILLSAGDGYYKLHVIVLVKRTSTGDYRRIGFSVDATSISGVAALSGAPEILGGGNKVGLTLVVTATGNSVRVNLTNGAGEAVTGRQSTRWEVENLLP